MDLGGFSSIEWRHFSHPQQSQWSLVMQPEIRREWEDGKQRLTFIPFLRLDQRDPERSHFDIRELVWLKTEKTWELRVGICKLFWGVTESQHLVDIINQTDWVENPDGEDKLGQLMVNLAWIRPWGHLDLFILPGFRARTFPGPKGRSDIPMDGKHARYESGAKEKHVDGAIRWSRNLGAWDIGLAHFLGTNREPRWFLDQEQPTRVPYYEQIKQTSLDLQLTQEAWLWKWEMISRRSQADHFTAFTGGLEYTLTELFDRATEMETMVEYSLDNRHNKATTLFDHEVMIGCRWVFNDVQSTELLTAIFLDVDNRARFYNLEASRRLGKNWKLSLEARIYANAPPEDIASRQEDYWQLGIAWYF